MNVYGPIETYLNTILIKQLDPIGVNPNFAARLIGTVRAQMQSLIFHWHDGEFRKAILRIGSDEGIFYKPYAPDDIRNFVVVTVRNSELECLHADDFQLYGANQRLSEITIKTITAAAIEYFGKLDFDKMSGEIEKPEQDIYEKIADKFPVSVQLLMELASNNRPSYDFEQIAVYEQPALDLLPVVGETSQMTAVKRGDMIQSWSDGYAFAIDRKLKEQLLGCAKDGAPFVTDSFKSLSRNVEKVLSYLSF
ncbi:hypothetical protein FACS1894208_06070 [Clostridia bacterium]|nr:hypothetical protein FACS1894208_06070 [Clostridia bacterium]